MAGPDEAPAVSPPVNPYQAPGTAAVDTEEDIAASAAPLLARLTGGVVALAGGVVGLTGVQTLIMVRIRGPVAVAPWVLVLLGAPHVVLGVVVLRARVWGALASLGGTGLMVLASGAWLVLSLGHGLFSLYALASPCVSLGALIMVLLSLGSIQRASSARARLRAQGLDLGL